MSFTISLGTEKLVFDQPTKVLDIVGNDRNIICVKVNNRVRELTYVVDKDAEIVPLTFKDRDAKPCYEASLRYLVAMAMHRINPEIKIRFSYNVSRSIFMQILNPKIFCTSHLVLELEEQMKKIVQEDIPLVRKILSKEDAEETYKKWGYDDKVEILKYRPEKTAHIYSCAEYENYMYNRMVPSTGYISKYKLLYYAPGIIIQYPRPDTNGTIPPFEDAPTFGKTLKKAHEQAIITGADSIVGINRRLQEDGPIDLISLSEASHARQLTELGDMIQNDIEDIRLICIAGPSSSGKTTFANWMNRDRFILSAGHGSAMLYSMLHFAGFDISLDDYYLTKEEIPLDEKGETDYESIEALDIERFNSDMADLIAGFEVEIPKFDFKVGHRVEGRRVKLGEGDPVIIEGIHALNERMTSQIPSHQKFKIFIAPQAQISIDNVNPMSITDLRLLRRIVRDYQFRNSSATETLSMWNNVRLGEFKWIYKTQEGANYVFNSFLNYELCAMKKYAMPLLQEIDVESQYYPVAERLIRMLKFFIDMPDEWVPCNSLLREFIGGSCFADV